jgi:hypothetical protein
MGRRLLDSDFVLWSAGSWGGWLSSEAVLPSTQISIKDLSSLNLSTDSHAHSGAKTQTLEERAGLPPDTCITTSNSYQVQRAARDRISSSVLPCSYHSAIP